MLVRGTICILLLGCSGSSHLWKGVYAVEPPPPLLQGDTPDDPILISAVPVSLMGDTNTGFSNFLGGGDTGSSSLGLGPDVFYSFTPDEDVVLTLDTCGSSFDTVLAVLTSNLTVLAVNDDDGEDSICDPFNNGGAATSLLQGLFLPGDGATQYFIVVDGFQSSSRGNYELSIAVNNFPPPSPPSPPPSPPFPPSPPQPPSPPPIPTNVEGDTPLLAVDVDSIPIVLTDNTAGAFTNALQGDLLGNGPDKFFRYTPPIDMVVTVETCGSSFDTEIGVFVEENMTMIASADDGGCANITDSHISGLGLAADTSYIIAVDGFGEDDFGDFTLSISIDQPPPPPLPPPPSGDTVGLGIRIESLPFSTTGDTSAGFANVVGGDILGDGPDVFYLLALDEDTSVTITTCGSSFDTIIGIFDTTTFTGELQGLITFNDSSGDSGPCSQPTDSAIVDYRLDGNGITTEYAIVVDGVTESSKGQYNLVIDIFPSPPPPSPIPAGDTPSTAFVIESLPAIFQGNTLSGFGNYFGAGNFTNGVDVFFRFTPMENITISVTPCGSQFDTIVGILTSNLEIVASMDDSFGDFDIGVCPDSVLGSLENVFLEGNGTITYFIILEGVTSISAGEYVLTVVEGPLGLPIFPPGDVNLDGQVTVQDVVLALSEIIGSGEPLSIVSLQAADVNQDFAVNIEDVVIIVGLSLGTAR